MTSPELTPAQIVIELAVALATERAAHAQTRADTSAKTAQLSAVLERERGEMRAFSDDVHALAARLINAREPLDFDDDTDVAVYELAERAGVSLPTSD